MILLAVDTATTSCSVALLRDRNLLAETVYTAGNTHSRQLMAMIDGLLTRCGLAATDVDAIGVSRGPGTFTGLRIGISTVKGLAMAIRAPVVGVSSLAALAFPFRHHDGPVVPMIDARRGEVYHICYEHGACIPDGVGDAAVDLPDTVAVTLPPKALLVGSGAVLYQELFAVRCPEARLADPSQHVIRAAAVGLLALERVIRNDVDAIDRLVPHYVRKSDAQIHR